MTFAWLSPENTSARVIAGMVFAISRPSLGPRVSSFLSPVSVIRFFNVCKYVLGECDKAFVRCLRKAKTRVANALGRVFFNVAGLTCYKFDYPIKVRRNWLLSLATSIWSCRISAKVDRRCVPSIDLLVFPPPAAARQSRAQLVLCTAPPSLLRFVWMNWCCSINSTTPPSTPRSKSPWVGGASAIVDTHSYTKGNVRPSSWRYAMWETVFLMMTMMVVTFDPISVCTEEVFVHMYITSYVHTHTTCHYNAWRGIFLRQCKIG